MADMVGKALRVLSLLGEHPDGVGLSELARRAGYPVSTTHRLLSSLQDQGFARSDPGSKRYVLGLRLFELGQRVSHARGFAGVALPVLRSLTEQTGEPTLMAVLDGHEQVYVHSVHGPRQIQIRGEPGRRGPLHCTSMGKCLVAFSPRREELVSELELAPLAPRTITARDEFAREVESVRARGYAVADEEHEPGIRAVGVPVLGPDGFAIAALSTAAPAYRMSMGELEAFVPALRAAARELGAVLPR
ncbi:IclR family transcriptional regulator [Amycolatopsis thermophila]|uniref:DNA-binding IclR family transcriptional regulator n=1 Tax=Amycolatopsis thermophila TaxID=206084 RepID=A0ABU0EY58_9PSEU|nr:IclR family transcriptional regulator [Amycolatopsis thermophila]MDQ0379795.1 DNA-binding IclR family transcriptional regulator [Amycolatopsis thermophila]